MKNFNLFLITMVAVIFSLCSCAKEYECECSYSGFSGNYTEKETYIDVKKKNAKDHCVSYEAKANGVVVEKADCKLK